MQNRVTVCVFAKPPVAGASKTRLAPSVGLHGAAALAGAFLEDTWAMVNALGWAFPVLVTTEVDTGIQRVTGEAPLWLQGPGDLGARLERTLQRALASGSPVIALGADSPGLPASCLEELRAALEDHDAVLGPAEDGGYYAIGVRRCAPGTFAGLPWSSANTRQATVARLQGLGFDVAVGTPWFDVDRPEDLERLHRLIVKGEVSAPATARAIAQLNGRRRAL